MSKTKTTEKKSKKQILSTESGQNGNNHSSRIEESGKITISLEHIVECKHYGLIVEKTHKYSNQANHYNQEILKELKKLSSKYWHDFSGKNSGFEKIDEKKFKQMKMVESMQEALRLVKEKLGLSDVTVYITRFNSQNSRCLGLRKGETFYIVCFEYSLNNLYNHGS